MDGIPPPLDDDDDDVAWALQTAAVQWQRNAHADAVVWLHRAVDAAISAGKPQRAHDLTVAAQELTQQIAGGAPAVGSEPPLSGDRVSLSMDVEFQPSEQPVFEIARRPPPPRRGAGPPPPRPGSLPQPKPPPPPRQTTASAAPALRQPPAAPAFPPVPMEMPPPEPRRQSSRPPPARQSRPPDVFERLPERLKKSSQPPPPPPPPPSFTADQDERAPFPYSQPPPPVDMPLDDTVDALLANVQRASAQLGELGELAESSASDAELPAESGEPSEIPAAADSAPPASTPSEPPPAPMQTPAPAPTPTPTPAPVEEPAADEAAAPLVEGVSLAEVRGLEDLPADAQAGLVEKARVEALGPDEEIGGFGVALVLEGDVRIMPSIADVACAFAAKGEVVFTSGSLEDGVMLRVVAGEAGARVAVWEPDALAEATASCPWVADELRLVADRYQALAGATMGAMGDRLDSSLLAMVTGRCDVRVLLGGEVLLEPGKPVDGMYIVGAGRIELVSDGDILDELGPGDFLFAEQILAAGSAPSTARAGKTGALLLFAPRMTAHELLVSVPPLLEILAG